MTEHRWSKFWWQDYESDDALRVVSLAAQGLWMRMLCTMHKGAPYGHLTINSKQPTNRQIALMASTTEREAGKLLGELEEAGVFSRIEDGTIYNRRMVRDKALSEKAHADGKRGGNPALKPISEGGLTPPDNGGGYSLEAEADTEAEAEKKDPPSLRSGTPQPKGRGSRLPDDWQPKELDLPSQHGAEPAGTLAHFRDHYRAKPGAAGVMLDWEAAWRNWCRKISDFKRAPPGRLPVKTSQMSVPDQNAELLRLMGRHYESEDETPATQLRIVQ